METTRLWLEEGNITDNLIAFIQQNSSKICRKKSWKTQASELIRSLSRELNVSTSTTKLALNEDLRYYSYKRHSGELLTEKARENCLTKGKKCRKKVKHPQISSDEKNFC